MFGKKWQLFRLMGVPIAIDATWLIILALLTLSLARAFAGLMANHYPDAAAVQPPWLYWAMGIVTALGFFGCILLHELGHAVVARSQRIPVRGITLFLFGGVAEIGDEPPSPKAEFLMAVAGPVVSVILGLVLGLLALLGYQLSWPPQLILILGYLAGINILVLVFNLVPAFPLDGGRIFRSILWWTSGNLRRSTYFASRVGLMFAWALIAWGILELFAGNWLGGIWLGMIGLFVSNGAQASYQQVLVRQALQGESVARFMNPRPIVVSPSLDLRQWVEDYVYHHHRKSFPVVSDGRLEGYIDTHALEQVPRGEWDRHTVGELMRRDLQAITVAPQDDALEALGRMQRSGNSRLVVADRGQLVGILSLKDLLRFLSLKIELEGEDESDARPTPIQPLSLDRGRPGAYVHRS